MGELYLHVVFLGTRGVPGRYSGFETFVEQLGSRMVERGHHVVVFNRTSQSYREPSYKGMVLVRTPAIYLKSLETLTAALWSSVVVVSRLPRPDLCIMCNVATAPVAWIPKVFGIPVILNVDGLEWKRKKWGRVARLYFKFCERLALRSASLIVTDAHVVRDYYLDKYGRETRLVTYGVDSHDSIPEPGDKEVLRRYDLTPRGYILYVGRLVPENNAEFVAREFTNASGPAPRLKLAIVGDSSYTSAYRSSVEQWAGPNVLLLGGVYGDAYWVLQRNAAAYVQSTEVGGTHPALLEAMVVGSHILANDVPEHREVLKDCGDYYRSSSEFRGAIQQLQSGRFDSKGAMARARVLTHYTWDAVLDAYADAGLALIAARRNARVALSVVKK